MTTCRSCGATILFAITEKGRWMPLDLDPVAGGNVLVTEVGTELLAKVVGPGAKPLHRSHFVTCPKAAQHRRRGPERRPGQ